MLQVRIFAFLAKFLTVMVCWIIVMGLPLLFFRPPLDPFQMKVFLGVFYALLLVTGTVISRSWGAGGLVFMAFPFLLLFGLVAGRAIGGEGPGDDAWGALNFLAIYPVTWLCWRLGSRWKSPAREDGRLL